MTDRLREALRKGADKAAVPPLADEAIRSGRRLGRIRKAVASGAVGVTALGVVGGYAVIQEGADGRSTDDLTNAADQTDRPAREAVALPTSCVVDRLPVPDGTRMSFATDVDSTGTQIAGLAYPQELSPRRPVLWNNGELELIDAPGLDASPNDVNSSGTVIGTSIEAAGDRGSEISWIYQDGQVSVLPGDGEQVAMGINDNGDIGGYVRDADGHEVPVMWPAGSDEYVELELPDGVDTGSVWDIDADGTLVGSVGAESSAATGTDDGDAFHDEADASGATSTTPYIWAPDGTGSAIPMPDDVPGGAASEITDGWVTIPVWGQQDGPVVVRWDSRGSDDAAVVDLYDANAVTAGGWLGGENTDRRAALHNGVDSLELPGLIDDLGEYAEDWAEAMSADGGVIVGRAATNADWDEDAYNDAAVVWTCE